MATSNYETVTIPTTSNPFRVIVNGVEYKYEAGATVEVPPEVAAAINASVNAAADLVKPGEVKPPFGASGGSGGGSDLTPIYIIDQDNVFSSSATFEEVWQLPPNVLATRLIFTRNASTVDLGHGDSCCGVVKHSTRSFGDNFVLRFVLRSPSSDLTCVTEGIVLVWHSNGIERMTSDED